MKSIIRALALVMVLITPVVFCSCSENANGEAPIVSPEVKAAFDEAVSAIVKLDGKTIARLKKDYEKQFDSQLYLSTIVAKPGEYLGGTWCYGNFDSCIVVFSPTVMQAIGTSVVAGEVFTYSTLFNLWGYHDGVFYNLSEAYEKGFITKEEVREAAERHRAIGRYNALCTTYEKAKNAVKNLDGETIDSIDNALKVNGVTAEWLDLDKKTMFTASHLRSYGDYNGCIVLLLTTQNPDDNVKTIADRTFESSGVGISLWGYYEGALYDLQDAYEKGFISQHDIGVAAARHNDVERYIEMITEN